MNCSIWLNMLNPDIIRIFFHKNFAHVIWVWSCMKTIHKWLLSDALSKNQCVYIGHSHLYSPSPQKQRSRLYMPEIALRDPSHWGLKPFTNETNFGGRIWRIQWDSSNGHDQIIPFVHREFSIIFTKSILGGKIFPYFWVQHPCKSSI